MEVGRPPFPGSFLYFICFYSCRLPFQSTQAFSKSPTIWDWQAQVGTVKLLGLNLCGKERLLQNYQGPIVGMEALIYYYHYYFIFLARIITITIIVWVVSQFWFSSLLQMECLENLTPFTCKNPVGGNNTTIVYVKILKNLTFLD